MISKGIKKYLVNPSLGLLVGVLYLLLYHTTRDTSLSLIISIISAGLGELVFRFYMKSKVSGLFFLINAGSLILTFILWFFLRKIEVSGLFYIMFYEIVFICILLPIRLGKTYLSFHLSKKASIVQKTFLSEFFEISQLTQYALTLHLFLLFIYRHTREGLGIYDDWNIFFYIVIPIIFLLAIIIYEEIKTRNIVRNLRKEEWLPIVNDSGEVTGRIAKSVSMKMKNRFLHPVVRVALVYDGKLYLQKRSANSSFDPLTYDHPFEKYMLLNHEINTAVRNSITRSLNKQELPFNFLLKYVFENENTKRLIFLFVSRVETEEQLNSLSLLHGKFWTMKQIEDSFTDKGVFSESFQLEYEYLKNTVLLPELLKKEVNLD